MQEQAHTSKDLHHRDTMKLRRERCITAPQGCPVPVRETSGTRRQERAHTSKDLHHRNEMKLRRESFQGSIRASEYVTSGNKILASWNITTRNSRQWRGEDSQCCQVRSRDDTEWIGSMAWERERKRLKGHRVVRKRKKVRKWNR